MRKEELSLLRDDDLLHLARNPSCNCRADAIRLLVERSSHHAGHPDIAAEASALLHADPLILKKIDPAAAFSAHRLPGLIEILAKDVKDTRAVEQKASALEQNLNQTADGLRGTIAEKEQALKQQHEDLRASLGKDLSELYERLNETSQALLATQTASSNSLEKKQEAIRTELLVTLGAAQELYGKRTDALEARLARLERSLWRKIVDWFKGR
jgi:hypothetical protein